MNWVLGSEDGCPVSGVVNFEGILRAVRVEGRSGIAGLLMGEEALVFGSLWSLSQVHE